MCRKPQPTCFASALVDVGIHLHFPHKVLIAAIRGREQTRLLGQHGADVTGGEYLMGEKWR